MNNLSVKSSVYLLVGVSAIVWMLLSFFDRSDLSTSLVFLGYIPKVAAIDFLLVIVFVKWGWRLKIFRGWLVPFPDLNGTWVGELCSSWVDPSTQEKLEPIPVMLTVRQSFFHQSYVMRTSEMVGDSYSEGFILDPDRQLKLIAYSYTSKPRLSLSERSNPHDGTAVLELIEKPTRKLKGRYWTERLTKGEVALSYYSKDLLEEMPEDISGHPLSEQNCR